MHQTGPAMRDHGRYPYLPIHARPDYAWPDGRRLAVYLGYNLEHFSFGEGLGAKLGPASPEPDVLNYSWTIDGVAQSEHGPTLKRRLDRASSVAVRVDDGSGGEFVESWQIEIVERAASNESD